MPNQVKYNKNNNNNNNNDEIIKLKIISTYGMIQDFLCLRVNFKMQLAQHVNFLG